MTDIVELTRMYRFEAAHWLPKVPPGHKCGTMHGHSYTVALELSGPVGAHGMLVDYADIDACVDPLISKLDHQVLNDFLANPTVELLAIYLWDALAAALPLSAVTVAETERAHATYRGPQ